MDQVFIFHKTTISASSVEEHSSGTNVDFFSAPLDNLVSIAAISSQVIFYFREGNLFENSKANMAKVTVNVTPGTEARVVSEFWAKVKRDQYPEGIIFIDDESKRYSISNITSISSIKRYTTERFSSGGSGSFVPYTGATGGVDLGAFGLTTDYVSFSLTPVSPPGAGQIVYDAATGALAYNMNGSSVTSQIGQTLHAFVHNAEAVTINKGEVVYAFGATGNKASVKLANNTSDATSAKTFGLAAENITAGSNGFIICQGVLDGLNTSAFTDGDSLYLDSVSGGYTSTKPYAPNHLVYVGTVERANAGNGQIYVNIQNGYELDEIHNVNINHNVVLADKDYLVYNNSNSLWENRQLDIVNDTTPQLGGNLDVNGNSIVSTSNGNISITPNGTGNVVLDGINYPQADGTNGQVLQTNGSAQLSFYTLKTAYYDIAPIQAGTIASGTTLYYLAGNITSSATQSLRQKSYGEDVTLKNLFFRTYGTQPGTGSLVINITSAPAYTGAYTNRITITIAAGSAAAHFEEVATTYSLAKGDYVGMSVRNNASGASAGFTGFGYKVEFNAF